LIRRWTSSVQSTETETTNRTACFLISRYFRFLFVSGFTTLLLLSFVHLLSRSYRNPVNLGAPLHPFYRGRFFSVKGIACTFTASPTHHRVVLFFVTSKYTRARVSRQRPLWSVSILNRTKEGKEKIHRPHFNVTPIHCVWVYVFVCAFVCVYIM